MAAAHRALAAEDRRGELGGAGLERLGEAAYMLGRETEFVEAFERASTITAGTAEPGARPVRVLDRTDAPLPRRIRPGSGGLQESDRRLEEDADCAERGYLMLPMVEQCLDGGAMEGGHAHATRAAEISPAALKTARLAVLVLHERKSKLTLMARLAGKTAGKAAGEIAAAIVAMLHRLDGWIRAPRQRQLLRRHAVLRNWLGATTPFARLHQLAEGRGGEH